jgi:DNA-binding CsgD family transcriptional regulator
VLALSNLLQGKLVEAAALIQSAIDAAGDRRWPLRSYAQTVLSRILMARGSVEEAAIAMKAVHIDPTLPGWLLHPLAVYEQQGWLHLANEQFADALHDFDDARVAADGRGVTNPAFTSWRIGRSAALAGLGATDSARKEARLNHSLAQRFGASAPLAAALRAVATLAPAHERVELLSVALTTIEDTPAELEQGLVLADLGAALRGVGDLEGARRTLRSAADVAVRCGASPLMAMVRAELRAAGARPRRLAQTGAAALTPSEHRAAALAAQGRTNTAIAAELFISVKTVESHLARAFRKLGVQSRVQIGRLLVDPAPGGDEQVLGITAHR